jgi:hypothetical protein
MIYKFSLFTLSFSLICSSANAVDVIGGRTSVALDTATLAQAASLNLSGVSANVINPGELPGSVAFPINSRTAASPLLPTTFSYDPANFLGSFRGKIEHEGSVFFNTNSIEVGNFTIDFDASRAVGATSGFFVKSNVGIPATLFDVAAPSALTATPSILQIQANLLVSPEFANFLQASGLASVNLTGADVGDAFVNALVPEPSGGFLLAATLFFMRRIPGFSRLRF